MASKDRDESRETDEYAGDLGDGKQRRDVFVAHD
jgi:hypothetical protein